jgi:hypothetical protein
MKINTVTRLKATHVEATEFTLTPEAKTVLQKLESIFGKSHPIRTNYGLSTSWQREGKYTAEFIIHKASPQYLEFDFHPAGFNPLRNFIRVGSSSAQDLLKKISQAAKSKDKKDLDGDISSVLKQLM